MDPRLGSVRRSAHRAAPGALLLLEEWLRIPSVSGAPAHRGDVERAARWVARLLRTTTPSVSVRATPGGPLVVARTAGTRASAPMTVVYGHLDVKAPGPGWTTPPFSPTRDGHRLRARGASDDKGQVMAHLAALRAWRTAGGPPGDVVTIVDGAEEIGSPGLARALADLRGGPLAGRAAAVVVVDTRGAGPGRPTVTVSQRGSVPLWVVVDTGGAPVHAGRLGGTVVDPSLVLAAALARAARAAAGLRGECRAPARAPTDELLRRAAAGRAMCAGDLVAAATRRGALTVSHLEARAARGAVPTTARALVDVRIPPGTPAAPALRILGRALRAGLPAGVSLHVRAGRSTTGGCLSPAPEVLAAVGAACRAGHGRAPVRAASGGSIPAVRVLARTFGSTPVLLGLGPADDGAHGPDEYLDLRDWAGSVDTHVVLLDTVASICRKPSREPQPSRIEPATFDFVVQSWGSRAQRSGVT